MKTFKFNKDVPLGFVGHVYVEDDGCQYWLKPSETPGTFCMHREDGPATIYDSGTKFWWNNGEKHRLDGPAVERHNGEKEFWIHDKSFMPNQYWNHPLVIKYKLNKIKDIL